MGAEDFSFFLEKRPGKTCFESATNQPRCDFSPIIFDAGCFFFVGCGMPGEKRPHHKSVFDFDEVSQFIVQLSSHFAHLLL